MQAEFWAATFPKLQHKSNLDRVGLQEICYTCAVEFMQSSFAGSEL